MIREFLPCGHNAHWTPTHSIERGEKCPLCEVKYWRNEARRYSRNADYWRERAEAAERKGGERR